ncbi:MAG: hypothetical protein H0T49_07010 [Chloroflexia bacterium]|nr:hypothetical protein [Chloroflexia bacterium]
MSLETAVELTGTPAEYTEGFNFNGIVATDDGADLIAVKSNTGQLFWISLDGFEITEIDLGGQALKVGDGIALDGQTLFVTRNMLGLIVPVELSDDFSSGAVGEPFTAGSLHFPTTIAQVNSCILVVNSQFDRREREPELPFTVALIAIPGGMMASQESMVRPAVEGC